MFNKYDDFINEALDSEMKIGDYIQFKNNLKNYKTAGTYAQIVGKHPGETDPTKTVYELEIDINGQKKVILMSKIENLTVIDKRKHELIRDGRIVKPIISDIFRQIIGRVINFDTLLDDYLDITFIDIDHDRDDVITYLQAVKAKDIYGSDAYTSKQRQFMRVGRFFRKIIKDRKTEGEIEKLVDVYKASWDKYKNFKAGVNIVSGEDIRYWYLQDRYEDGEGSLNSSCMRYEESQKRFNIYCENPDKISLIIITNEKDKLVARALLWKVDDPKLTYLDRIYYTEKKYEVILTEKAREMGWLSYSNRDYDKPMDVHLERNFGDPEDNPYMDTFRYFYEDGCCLTNYDENENADLIYDDND